jgi:hypothetical protein
MTKKRQRRVRQQRHRERPAVARRGKSSNNAVTASDRPSDEEWVAVLRAHFQRRHRQKLLGGFLVAGAAVVFGSHMLEHTGVFQILSPGLQDLLIGYPTALLFLIVAVLLLGQSDRAPKRPMR